MKTHRKKSLDYQLKKQNFQQSIFTNSIISPAIIVLLCISLLPIILMFLTSLTDLNLINLKQGTSEYIGGANYQWALTDSNFWSSMGVTIKFTLLAVISQLLVGLFMAVFMHNQKPTLINKIIRVILLLPALCPPISMTLIWQTMFSNNNGIINQILNAFGIANINWLQDINYAFYSVLIVDIWQYAPFVFLLLYTALTQFPSELEEASKIDGANKWQTFFYVTLPYLKNTIGIVALLRTIDSFRLFDKVNVLTGGGPANSTRTISMYIYQTGIDSFELGRASTSSILMTLVVFILAAPYIKNSFNQIKASISKKK